MHPISPEEIANKKLELIPEIVIKTFNKLIAHHYVRGTAVVQQSEVVEKLVQQGLTENEVFGKGMLNVEHIYEAVGWTVSYDKPAYNESYPASFTFKRTK